MMKLMIYIKSLNIEESVDFYKKIGFYIYSDYLDGDGNRNVEMNIFKFEEITIKFRLVDRNCIEKESEVKNSVISLLVGNAYEYACGISNFNIIFDRKINAFESVFYCNDPCGNEICITDDDFY